MTVARNAAGKANPRGIPRVYHKILRHGKFLNFFLSSVGRPLYKRAPEECICPVNRQVLFGIVVLALIVPSAWADLFPSSGPLVSGKTARLRFGRAAAPKNAPLQVKRAVWAANQLRSKPYRYGGGHKSFDDHGYDCSGTISYVLAAAGFDRFTDELN
jgi:hypothetical protein